MHKLTKSLFTHIVAGLLGFYLITTTLISGRWIWEKYYSPNLTVTIEPDRLIEQLSQSSYEFEADGNSCRIALKDSDKSKHKY